jgi:hypothetical protein
MRPRPARRSSSSAASAGSSRSSRASAIAALSLSVVAILRVAGVTPMAITSTGRGRRGRSFTPASLQKKAHGVGKSGPARHDRRLVLAAQFLGAGKRIARHRLGNARRRPAFVDDPVECCRETLDIAGRESCLIGGASAKIGLADLAHLLRHGEVADTHLTERIVHVGAEEVESLLSGLARLLSARLETPGKKDEMEQDHLESAGNAVRHGEIRVERRLAGLRHDRAVKRGCYALALAIALEESAKQSSLSRGLKARDGLDTAHKICKLH